MLNALSAHIAVLDGTGRIVSVNEAWRRFGRENGLRDPAGGVGSSYLDVCDRAAGGGDHLAAMVAAGLRSLAAGGPALALEYPCHGPAEPRWFQLRATRFEAAGETRIAVAHENVTARKLAEERLERRGRALEALNAISVAISGELDRDRLVQLVVDGARALVGAAFGAFFHNVVDPSGESYTLYTLSGAPREAFASFPMPRNTGVFAPTFRGEGVVRSDDITKDPRYGRNAPYRGMPEGHLPVRSYPARAGRRPLGRGRGRAVLRASGTGGVRRAGRADPGGHRRPGGRGAGERRALPRGPSRDRGTAAGRGDAGTPPRGAEPPGEEHARRGRQRGAGELRRHADAGRGPRGVDGAARGARPGARPADRERLAGGQHDRHRGGGGRPDEPRAETEGGDSILLPHATQSLGLILHELATNAAKHGSPSAPEGRVRLAWSVDGERFRLSWRESGGPAVAPPARAGFGRLLLERAAAHDLGGQGRLEFRPAGVAYELETPAGRGRGRRATPAP